MKRRNLGALGAVLAAVAVSLCVFAVAGAGAATRITEPSANPYHVTIDAAGKPVPFTIVAGGFPVGHQVFVEQCDGLATTAPHWTPTRDCDLGGSPTPAIVDAQGNATFPATNPNRVFVPVMGESPESLFNCLKPGTTPPKNDLPNFTTCQIRVSTNNTQATDDQVFLSIVFGGSAPATSGSSSSSSSSTGVVIAILIVVLVVVVGGVAVLSRRRRRPVRTR